jgi:hypothetical protein
MFVFYGVPLLCHKELFDYEIKPIAPTVVPLCDNTTRKKVGRGRQGARLALADNK